jgi:hypothetical protein
LGDLNETPQLTTYLSVMKRDTTKRGLVDY